MAEIVGLVSGILTLAGAAAKISVGLYQIASDIGSAGKDIRAIASDTNAFSQALTNLSQVLGSGSATTNRARAIAQDLVTLCREMLSDSLTLLRVLEPLVKLTGKRWKRAALRVRWLFEKSKFAYHRQSLEPLKATLTLLVATMTYANGSNLPAVVSESLRVQLESVKEEARLSAKDYEPLLQQIQNEVQTMRADALIAFAKIDQESTHKTPTSTVSVLNDADNVLEFEHSREIAESDTSQDELAVPVAALAITTGLPGLPYLQRQALRLAEDVLDELEDQISSVTDASVAIALRQVSATDMSSEGIESVIQGGPSGAPGTFSSSAGSLASVIADLSLNRDISFQGAKQEIMDEEKHKTRKERSKALFDEVKREAKGKIAFSNFKVGDLALFLPTRNQATRPWAAFNVGAPHYFLRHRPEHRLDKREWLVARIRNIETHVVDDATDENDADNPYQLSSGLCWWMVDARVESNGSTGRG